MIAALMAPVFGGGECFIDARLVAAERASTLQHKRNFLVIGGRPSRRDGVSHVGASQCPAAHLLPPRLGMAHSSFAAARIALATNYVRDRKRCGFHFRDPNHSLQVRMSIENPPWGAARIHGEPLKAGFDVAQSSLTKYMLLKRSGPRSHRWDALLRATTRQDIAAMDLFIASTIGLRSVH
jgi:hypothetical protein